jgi:membrane-associated protease RseP (regulator of RpoE activity)
MIIFWIFVSIILFSIIVLVHEFWHFIAARKFWVRVEEFGLWIPPRAKKLFRDKKGTLFTLNWLPIGGFVKLTWEMPNTFLVYNEKKELYNNEDLEKDLEIWKDVFMKNGEKIWKYEKDEILKKLKENTASYNLMNKPSWQQAIIILAWVFMNFLLASVIFSILFFTWIKPIWINTKIETDLDLKLIPTYEQSIESWLLIKNKWIILSPVKDSIAQKAWIKDWDILLSIDWKEINTPKEMLETISSKAWKKVIFTLSTKDVASFSWQGERIDPLVGESSGQERGLSIWENWKIWAYIWENVSLNTEFEYKYSIIDSIKYWVFETYNQSLLTFKWLWILVTKIFNPKTPQERTDAIAQVSWPVWIVDFISNSLEWWIVFLFIIWAIISINLWVFNLLPIPALDGWRFLFITINSIIEKIFGKKAINEQIEWIIHVWFFVFLIALSLLIAYNDIIKIIIR